MMLFIRLSWPAKLMPLACGVMRTMSLMRPVVVGSVASSSRASEVAAPVLVELNSVEAVTVTTSSTAATFSLKERSVDPPRLTVTLSMHLCAEPGQLRRDLVRPAHAHARE